MSKDPDTAARTEAHEKHRRYMDARTRADMYPQRYPGEGFTHELEGQGPGCIYESAPCSIELIQSHRITCPCGQPFVVSNSLRHNKEVTIVQCPACFYWHLITWYVRMILNHFTPRER